MSIWEKHADLFSEWNETQEKCKTCDPKIPFSSRSRCATCETAKRLEELRTKIERVFEEERK